MERGWESTNSCACGSGVHLDDLHYTVCGHLLLYHIMLSSNRTTTDRKEPNGLIWGCKGMGMKQSAYGANEICIQISRMYDDIVPK